MTSWLRACPTTLPLDEDVRVWLSRLSRCLSASKLVCTLAGHWHLLVPLHLPTEVLVRLLGLRGGAIGVHIVLVWAEGASSAVMNVACGWSSSDAADPCLDLVRKVLSSGRLQHLVAEDLLVSGEHGGATSRDLIVIVLAASSAAFLNHDPSLLRRI